MHIKGLYGLYNKAFVVPLLNAILFPIINYVLFYTIRYYLSKNILLFNAPFYQK